MTITPENISAQRPGNLRCLAAWLAINLAVAFIGGFLAASLPARLKLLGLFSVAFGVAVGWIAARTAPSYRIAVRQAIGFAALFAVVGDLAMTARSWSLHAEAIRKKYLTNDIPMFAAPARPMLPPTSDPVTSPSISPAPTESPLATKKKADPIGKSIAPPTSEARSIVPDTNAQPKAIPQTGEVASKTDTQTTSEGKREKESDNEESTPPGLIPDDVRKQFREAREAAAAKKSTLRAYLEYRLAGLVQADSEGEVPPPWSWSPHWAFLFRGGELLLAGVAAAVTTWQLLSRRISPTAHATSPASQQLS